MKKSAITEWESIKSILLEHKTVVDKTTYILCENDIDAVKWKIAFHQAFDFSLIGVYFTTAPLLFKKIIRSYMNIENDTKSKLPLLDVLLLKRIITLSIQEVISDKNGNIGFLREITSLYNTIDWNYENRETIFEKYFIEIDKEQMIQLFTTIEGYLEYYNLEPIGRWVSTKIKENSFKFKKNTSILWMVPMFRTKKMDTMLHFFDSIMEPQWHIFLNPYLYRYDRNTLTELNNGNKSILSNPKFYDNTTIDKSINKEPTVFIVNNTLSQKYQLKNTVKNILEQEKDFLLTEVCILYSNEDGLKDIKHIFKGLSIPLHTPKVSSPLFTLVGSVIEILDLHTKGIDHEIEIDTLFFILKSPYIYLKVLDGYNSTNTSIELCHKIFKDFFFMKTASFSYLESIITNKIQDPALQSKEEVLSNLKQFVNIIKFLREISQHIKKASIKESVDTFNTFIKELFYSSNPLNLEDFTIVANICDQVYKLLAYHTCFKDSMDYFSFLKGELSSNHSKRIEDYTSFYSLEEKPIEGMGVIVRDLSDGIAAHYKYVIVYGLDIHYNYESRNSIFLKDDFPSEYKVAKKIDDKKYFLKNMQYFVETPIIYIVQKDEKEYLENILDKKVEGSHQSIAPEKIRTHDVTDCFTKEVEVAKNHIFAHYEMPIEKYLPYLGDIKGAKLFLEEQSFSPNSFSTFFKCPQQYWFQYILSLKKINDTKELGELDALEQGTLFHATAYFFLKDLKKQYPKISYEEIAKALNFDNPEEILKFLKIAFNKAVEADKSLYTDIVFQNEKKKIYELASKFFIHFFTVSILSYQPKGEDFRDNVPWLFEHEFNNISLLNFKFRGKIDRVDYNLTTKTIYIFDYKKKYREPTLAIEDIQVYVYIKAIAEDRQLLSHIVEQIPDVDDIKDYTMKFLYLPYDDNDNKNFTPKLPKFLDISSENSLQKISSIRHEFFLGDDTKKQAQHIRDMFEQQWMIATPYKEKNKWYNLDKPPCTYCAYTLTCDKNPYSFLSQRGDVHTIAKDFIRNIHEPIVAKK